MAPSGMYRDLALHIEASHDDQERRIEGLAALFRAAALAMALEVTVWMVDLAARS